MCVCVCVCVIVRFTRSAKDFLERGILYEKKGSAIIMGLVEMVALWDFERI